MRTVLALLILASASLVAQQATAPENTQSTAASPKQPVISPTARLNAAKTVYIKKVSGSNDIPFNVISGGFDGWAKYMVVNSPEKADLVVEVSATEQADSGFAVTSNTSTGITNGKSEDSVKTTKTFTTNMVRMVVVDNHTRTPLWAGNEQPRSAARKNKTEDNLVEAAQKLFQHFHDRVEPPAPAQ